MKLSTLTTAACLALATPIQAEPIDDYCAAVGDLAYRVMLDRQEGVAMTEQMRDAGPVYWIRETVKEAYNEYRFSGTIAKRDAAQNYRNRLEGICYRALEDGGSMRTHE